MSTSEEWIYTCEVCDHSMDSEDEIRDHMFVFHVNMIRKEEEEE